MSATPEHGMLPLVVRPFSGESVVSLIGRQANALCAPFSAVCTHLGINANFMLSDESWTRLANAIGVEEKDLSGMRRTTVRLGQESGGVGMLGLTLRHHLVNHGALRVCPSCLDEGLPMLERWDIVHAPVCLQHCAQLVDTCRCGRPLSRRRRGFKIANSCPCGSPYATLNAPRARPGLMAMGTIIDNALTGCLHESLDPALRGLPLSDLLCLAHVVGLAATTLASDDPNVELRGAVYGSVSIGAALKDVASIADLIEAAVPHLATWSDTYPMLLANVACRNEAAGTKSADAVFATTIGRMLRRPPRGIDGIPLSCMTVQVERFCENMFGIKPRKKSHRRDSPVGRKVAQHISRRKIAATLGVGAQSPALTRIFDEVVRTLDQENAATSTSAKVLAKRVEELVLRRWHNTNGTLSLDEASRRLSHPRSTHSPSDWIHPQLLVPIDVGQHGVDGVLSKRRNGISFLTSDVEAMRDRIAERTQTVATDSDMEGYASFAQCRKFHGGGWPRREFLLAFLAGRIPARSPVNRPHIADIWFETNAVRNLALEYRIRAVLTKDSFAIAYRCRSLVAEVWGGTAEDLSDYHLRHLRRTEAIRFKDVRNTTEGRDRPLYHYSIVDLLERARLIQGASITTLVDQLIDKNRASRAVGMQITVDAEQASANTYLAALASNAASSLHGRKKAMVENHNSLHPPLGWRRGSSALRPNIGPG